MATKRNAKEALDVDSCESCKYWIEEPDVPIEGRMGRCRQSAPRYSQDDYNGYNLGYFPVIWFGEWCGQYKRKTH